VIGDRPITSIARSHHPITRSPDHPIPSPDHPFADSPCYDRLTKEKLCRNIP